jgi:hypothetical protein
MIWSMDFMADRARLTPRDVRGHVHCSTKKETTRKLSVARLLQLSGKVI